MSAVPQEIDDLEALFDSIASEREVAQAAPPPAAAPALTIVPTHPAAPVDVYHRIGSLTRSLHDALRELGYDKEVEKAVGSLPDARARLSYIATLTGQAAEKVLAAVERGQSVQSQLQDDTAQLTQRWESVFAGALDVNAFKALAEDTRAHLVASDAKARETQRILTDIMMAQDFHDLTGQVIQRVVGVAQTLEEQLLKLLLESSPPEKRASGETWLSGPVVDAKGRDDVVTGQQQVDDLLESLGF